jgi:glutathione S-transferase
MKLYFSPGVCSLASHITVRELNLPVDLVKVDLRTKQTSHGEDFSAINKKGYVPALQFNDGSLLTEGVAIMQYLADQKPEAGLAPANGTKERYKLQEWLTFINSEIHKSYSPLFDASTPEQTKKSCLEKLDRRYGFVAEQLANQEFLLGKQFTVADAYLFTTMTWAGFFNLDFAKWPVLKDYFTRIAARESVQAARAAEKAA